MVRLDNENLTLRYVSKKIRYNFFIHLLRVNRVKID
nr:translation initiation factor 1 [Debregeasia saeneb]UNY34593.1 translation initiation factor 1 [Debregeasia saeneb]